MAKWKNTLFWTVVLLGFFGGIRCSIKEGDKFTNSSLYITKSKLETKLDSLQDKKNYWIALKESSELTDLANDFISEYDKQIGDASYTISKIENNPEFKKLKKKACQIPYSNGGKLMVGSMLLAVLGVNYFKPKLYRDEFEQQS